MIHKSTGKQAVRMFAWDPTSNIPGRTRDVFRRRSWAHGNFGDLFNFDLVKYLYGSAAKNASIGFSPRLFLVGSTLKFANRRDLIAGIGSRSGVATSAINPLNVIGVRGKKTQMLLERSFGSLRNLRFLGDPGLLASVVYGDVFSDKDHQRAGALFLPHFRDLNLWSEGLMPGDDLLSPDNPPSLVYEKIRCAEKVFTSSLHGLVFSHSAGVPCTLVEPSGEPTFKYEDYYSGIEEKMPKMISTRTLFLEHRRIHGSTRSIDKMQILNSLPDPDEIASYRSSN